METSYEEMTDPQRMKKGTMYLGEDSKTLPDIIKKIYSSWVEGGQIEGSLIDRLDKYEYYLDLNLSKLFIEKTDQDGDMRQLFIDKADIVSGDMQVFWYCT